MLTFFAWEDENIFREKIITLMITIFYAHWVLIRKWEKELLGKNISRNINTTSHLQMKSQCNFFGKSYKLFLRLLLEIIWKIIWFDLNQSLLIIPSKNDNHPRSYSVTCSKGLKLQSLLAATQETSKYVATFNNLMII